ncbi:unnamed protein product [Strongylus vulgaris]|uniref:Uncharacterized protein n=1 Tax=Strongylus vulgaris TaxID=40348 RepID=A0A3P7IKU6_STRVU|nr:unnamed protein product [Strongylus vulgaris]
MLIFFTLVVACLAKLDLRVKLSLKEAEKLTGSDLDEYLLRHQKLFKVGESKQAVERMKHLMDSKFLVEPKEEERKKIPIDKDEVIPEKAIGI